MSRKVLVELDLENETDAEIFAQLTDAKPAKGNAKEKAPREKASKGKSKAKQEPEEDEGEEVTLADLKEACAAHTKEFSAKETKALLEEFDVGTAAKAFKSDEAADILEALQDALEDGDDEEEEITVDDVKIACQAFGKENGKEELNEILESYDIKSVRSLSKLSDDDLGELYEEVTEDD